MTGRSRQVAVALVGQPARRLLATARHPRIVGRRRRITLALVAVVVAGMLAACGPEASRTRGGGPGADIGNHGAPTQMHGSPNPYYQSPEVGKGIGT